MGYLVDASGNWRAAEWDWVPQPGEIYTDALPPHPVADAIAGVVREKTNVERCADARADKIAQIKGKAGHRIFAAYPQTKQANLAASAEVRAGIALYQIGQALNLPAITTVYQPVIDAVGAVFPADSTAVVQACMDAWEGLVTPIRDASDLIEADLIALGDNLAAIEAFDYVNSARWPV